MVKVIVLFFAVGVIIGFFSFCCLMYMIFLILKLSIKSDKKSFFMLLKDNNGITNVFFTIWRLSCVSIIFMLPMLVVEFFDKIVKLL